MTQRALTEWLTEIEQQHALEIDLSLDRITQVAKRLSVLQFNCPVITVGGTNGKGSTVATLAAIYSAAGYRCGVYTSPHLLQFNERIVMNGEKVSDAALCEAFAAVDLARKKIPTAFQDATRRVRSRAAECTNTYMSSEASTQQSRSVKGEGDITLTYFEFTTLAALYLFQKNNLDVVILEIGLGGRLDAVNIVDSDVAIVTTVDLDHMDYLGNSREQIGAEKAEIFRSAKPAIYGDRDVVSTVIASAAAKGSLLSVQGKDFDFEEQEKTWHWHNRDHRYADLPKPRVLLHNASLALQAITVLESQLPVTLAAIHQGLAAVYVMGRFQMLTAEPTCIVDVAHNPQSSAMLLQQLNHLGWQGTLHIVFSMLATKDRLASLLPWQHCKAQWYLAPLQDKKAASLDAIVADFTALGITAYQKYDTIEAAYSAAKENATNDEIILVFGSFHTVTAVMQMEFIEEKAI